MLTAETPANESRRIEALRRYAVLDTRPEPALDGLAALAAQICGVPIALISLVDENRQWFKARVGWDLRETPRDTSFCGHTIRQQDLFLVSDTTQDERFADNPMVSGDSGIRFYAGAPLITPEGDVLGALCVMDRVPHRLTDAEGRGLRVLAEQVMTHLELRRQAHSLVESESRFRLLAENITDVFWIASPDLNTMYYVSPGYERTWGYSVENLYSNPHQWVESIVPEDRERVLQVFGGLMKDVGTVSVEYRILRPDGAVRWVHDRGFQVRDGAGTLTRLTGVAADVTERKEAELALRREAAIVSSSDDAIIGKDLNGVVTSWNKGAEKIFGYSIGEMVGASIMALIPLERRHEESSILERIRRGESIEHFETVRLTKDGRALEVSVTVSPIKDASGKVVGASKIARDITERRRAEQERRASEARYYTLFECAPDGILIADAKGRYLDANSSMCRMLGYTREDLIGQDATLIVAPAEILRIEPAVKEIMAGQGFQQEWNCRRKDGSVFSADVIATAMPDGNLLALVRDITEEKEARKRIAEQAALLDKARDAILVRDLEGNILYWNHGAERVYGWKQEEVTGRNIGEFLYRDVKKFAELNDRAIREGEWHGEVEHITRDKREISIEARWTLIRDDEGHPKSILAINTDITEKKKLEAQYLRAQRMESIGTLASGIAHDLNNILSPIMLSIEVLKDTASDPRSQKILETIAVSAQRGADIVRQVLSFGRGLEGQRAEVQPNHVLKDVEKIIKDTFPKDIRLEFVFPKETWTILADATHMHQILLNLCVNARDAMPSGGTLTVSAENCVLDEQYSAMHFEASAGRYVCIGVADSGTGIAREIMDKIFDPFFTTKDLNKGTGLGLATVMAIVKGHGGFVNVYSEPGSGTTFKIYLPAMEVSVAGTSVRNGQTSLPRGDGETILVVDDEDSILTITSQTLEAFGYRVLTAGDGADALAVYVQRRNEISVVLTDMMMPVMDGAATIQALRRINPKVKIIAASGLGTNGGTLKAGADIRHFLTKPYTAQLLLNALRSILHES